MINLVNKDRLIYDLEYRVVDILSEYLTNGKIEISVNSEGICLDRSGFYNLLDYIADKMNIDKKLISISTPNILEFHQEYTIKHYVNHWFKETRQNIPKNYSPMKNDQLKHIGCFIGKINWNRLILGSHLFKNFKDKILFTCHYRHEDSQKLQSELTELNFYNENVLSDAVDLMNASPITLDETFNSYTIGPPEHLIILNRYNEFFAELVLETYVMGNTFFPTEKTLRPIIAKSPFIVMGPKNYLKNLRNMGFQTFGRWWDESYDYTEGSLRTEQIKLILNDILSWSSEQLQNTLLEMEPVLQHNRNLYLETNYE